MTRDFGGFDVVRVGAGIAGCLPARLWLPHRYWCVSSPALARDAPQEFRAGFEVESDEVLLRAANER